MNMAIQPPLSYPFYMDRARPPLSMIPWSSKVSSPYPRQFASTYSLPQSLPPLALPQQRYPLTRNLLPSSSYSNVRYQHVKQLANYPHRRPMHRSVDASTRPHSSLATSYRSSKTKSINDFQPKVQFSSTHLPKAHSWHMMPNSHHLNLSVDYAKEMHITPKRPRKHSREQKKKLPRHHHHHQQQQPPLHLPSVRQRQLSLSPKRHPSFRAARKRPMQIPKRGVVRISTLDEMPIPNDQTSIQKNSISHDRSSMKGSISNSSKRQVKAKGTTTNSRKNRNNNNNENDSFRLDSDDQSSSSSSNSRLSLQQLLNGSLRNDPLIVAAMEDYRHLCRSSSQTTSLTPQNRNHSRDSLCSNSTLRSSPSSSRSRSNSQSSFTSVERSEIRELIKTMKKKDRKSSQSSISTSTLISEQQQPITTDSYPPIPMKRQRKSSLTEELDREFSKLRALDPNQEITYVTPSSICKRKKTNEKPVGNIPPLPTFDELLRQVQLRPVDKSIKPICFNEKPIDDNDDDNYENPLTLIPVPRSSPIPIEQEQEEEEEQITKPIEIKHEYAIPIKKSEKSFAQISHFQPMRNFKFNKSIGNIGFTEKRTSRSLSMLNWFQNNLTNPFPTTFQPNRNIDDYSNEYSTTSAKENIYTSDVDIYLPTSNIEKNEDLDSSLQMHLDNQTIITDDFYSDYDTKQKKTSSTILDDFSHLFQRKHKHQNKLHVKNQRCSIM